MEHDTIAEILERNGKNRSGIIAILQDVQSEYKYLPEDKLRYISEELEIPLIDLFSIASFYNSFSLTPQGEHLLQVCMGTACHVRGANRVLEKIEKKLNIQPGETTEDQRFTLKTVNCLGACALGPIVVVDETYHGNTRPQKVNAILEQYSNKNGNNGKTE